MSSQPVNQPVSVTPIATGTPFERVRECVVEQYCVQPKDVTPETVLLDIGDSLDPLELGMEIEDRIGLVVPDDEVVAWKTVADVVATVQRMLADSR